MPRKLGQSATDLFKKTEPARPAKRESAVRQPQAKRASGKAKARARSSEQASAKVTFLLTPSQTTFLDEICLTIKRKTGYGMRRTEVVRALIDALRSLEVSLDGVDSEEQLRQRILDLLS